MNQNGFTQKIEKFAGRVEELVMSVEKFVESNIIEKSQREQNLRKLSLMFERIIKDNLGGQRNPAIQVKVLKLEGFKGELPKYQSAGASGFDVRAQLTEDLILEPGERALIPTALSFEIPDGYEIQARPRSGLAIKEGISLVNTPGTIDADYRGEVKIIIINLGQKAVTIKDQDRIAQLVLCPVIQADFVESTTLGTTDRGTGGFGSTGK